MGVQRHIRGLDLFALPFRFSLGDEEKEKKTFIGGILSIIVSVTSLAYFIYLCYLYAANLMQPSIAQTEQFSTEPFTMNLSSDFLMVKVTLSNQQSLWEYQQQTKKILLQAALRYIYQDQNGKQVEEVAPGIPCASQDLSEYQCFKLPSFQESIPLHFNQSNKSLSSLMLFLTKCGPNMLPDGFTCETDQTIINKYLLNLKSNIEVSFGLKQYQTSSKSFIPNKRIETYILDPILAFCSRIDLQKSDTTINDGFLIQTSKDFSFLSGYSRSDSAMTQSFISQQIQVNAYGGIFINLKSNNISISIQFVQFTQLFAQFSSVFSSLMFLGIFSKLLAESEIAQSMIALQLKAYYKLTAVQLISLKKNTLTNDEIKADSDSIQLQKEIESLDFEQSLSQFLHLSLPKRIFSFISSSKTPKDSAEIRVYKQLLAQASKCFNIFYIQKEILQMKMMLRLILSPEQFAAALLCGSKLPIDLSKELTNKEMISDKKQDPNVQIPNIVEQYLVDTIAHRDTEDIQINQGVDSPIQSPLPSPLEDQRYNHLEIVDQIEFDSVVQGQYIQQFFDTCFDSEIDKRIKNCMIKIEQKSIPKSDQENRKAFSLFESQFK